MFNSVENYFKDMSWKARKLAAETTQISEAFANTIVTMERQVAKEYKVTNYFPQDELSMKLKFAKLYRKMYAEIFKQEIFDACFKSIEYTRKTKFFIRLADVIDTEIDFLMKAIIEGGYTDAKLAMEVAAGDMGDMMEGVEIARKMVKAYHQYTKWGKTETKARRDFVWREVIWPDDEYYDKTINIRMTAWGNKAPYWIFLDEGNQGFEGAYPKFSKTDFFYKAVQKCIIDLNERVAKQKASYPQGQVQDRIYYETEQYQIKVADLLYNALVEFEKNKDSYQPGYVFNRFKVLDQEYKIYVTPGKRLGIPKVY